MSTIRQLIGRNIDRQAQYLTGPDGEPIRAVPADAAATVAVDAATVAAHRAREYAGARERYKGACMIASVLSSQQRKLTHTNATAVALYALQISDELWCRINHTHPEWTATDG